MKILHKTYLWIFIAVVSATISLPLATEARIFDKIFTTAGKKHAPALRDGMHIRKGGRFTYSGTTWSSVGISYTVDYDKSAFSMTYTDIDKNTGGMCGGDETTTVCTFTANKPGTYTITVTNWMRSEKEDSTVYRVTVTD